MGDEVCHLDRRSPELPKAGPAMTFSIGMLFVRSPSSHSPRVILNVCPASCVGGSLGETAVAKESRRINLSKAWVEAPTR